MGADKTNNIMTLSSGASQPLLADVQYFELYSSSVSVNRPPYVAIRQELVT